MDANNIVDSLYRLLGFYKDHSGGMDSKKFERSVDEAIKTVKAESKWIPVSERLPEKVGYYLTTILSNDGYHRYRDIIYFGDDKQWTRDCNVIAWISLPEPWKGAVE